MFPKLKFWEQWQFSSLKIPGPKLSVLWIRWCKFTCKFGKNSYEEINSKRKFINFKETAFYLLLWNSLAGVYYLAILLGMATKPPVSKSILLESYLPKFFEFLWSWKSYRIRVL